MDLVSSIRKSGSRGGVNFSWDEVKDSTHRENYLGHSLMAPVGRWAKGRDLNWYAKADATGAQSDETEEERAARQRKDEIRKIKEAEEDAMARALGLPPPVRNTTGANSIEVGEGRVSRLEADSGTANAQEASTSRGRPGRIEKRGVDRERQHRHGHGSRSRDRRQDRSPRRREETKDRRPREDRDYDRRRRERSRNRDGDQQRHKRNRSRSRSRQRDAYRRRSRSRERKPEAPTKRERDSRSPPLRKRRSSSRDNHRRRTYN